MTSTHLLVLTTMKDRFGSKSNFENFRLYSWMCIN